MNCITHCDLDVEYRRYEFPHGEYLLPLNNDGTIHRCMILRENQNEIQITTDVISKKLGSTFDELFDKLINASSQPEIANYEPGDTEYTGILNNLLTTLFSINNICPEPFIEELPSPFPVGFGDAAILEFIGLCYSLIDDKKSSEKAQHLSSKINLSVTILTPPLKENNMYWLWTKLYQIRDEQSDKEIVEKRIQEIKKDLIKQITNKNYFDNSQSNVNYSENLEFDSDLQELLKNLEKIERIAKDFLRQKMTDKDIEKFFPDSFKEANKRRMKNVIYKRKNDDSIEFLSLGNLLYIFKGKLDRKLPANIKQLTPIFINFKISSAIFYFIKIIFLINFIVILFYIYSIICNQKIATIKNIIYFLLIINKFTNTKKSYYVIFFKIKFILNNIQIWEKFF